MKKKKTWFGKLMLGFLGIIGLLVVATLMIPLVVDVDKYRPQLIAASKDYLNGNLVLGKLSLSVFGQVRVEVDGLKLLDLEGNEVVGVKHAHFHLPFLSLLSGEPVLTFKMHEPKVSIVKDDLGKINLLNLLKSSKKGDQTRSEGSLSTLPAFATRARLGVELRDAWLNYQDVKSGLTTDVRDLNLVLRDISLTHPTDLELWASLNTQMGSIFKLKGPAKLTGKAKPDFKGNKIGQFALSFFLNLDNLEISAPGLIEKGQDVPMNANLAMVVSEKEARIESLSAKVFNAEIQTQGTITQLASIGDEPANPILHFKIKSNEIEFKPWTKWVPALGQYELAGVARFDAEVNGPSQKIGYQAKLTFNDLTAKAPQLKVEPKFDGTIQVLTDQIESLLITMKAPDNDIKVQGRMMSFAKPRAEIFITSLNLDLDQLISFNPRVQKNQAMTQTGQTVTLPDKVSKSSEKTDYDAMLEPVRNNKVFSELIALITVDVNHLKAKEIQLKDLKCQMSLKDLAVGVDKCGFNLFSGVISAAMNLQLKPKVPNYQYNFKVSGLNMKEAMESQLALFKDTVKGKASFEMSGHGSSLNSGGMLQNLKAKGKFRIQGAEFATIDVNKMVGDALSRSLVQVNEKIPHMKQTYLGSMANRASRYDVISSEYTILNGKYYSPNFVAKAAPNQGIDLRGSATVGLKDLSLNTSWEAIDTYNLTHARDLSVEQNGVRVDHLLAEGTAPVRFPLSVGCTLRAPCYSYTEVPEYLTRVALHNVGNTLSAKAKEEIKLHLNRAKDEPAKKMESEAKKAIKGLFR